MEGFRIDLKTFLGLAMPNQYSCQRVNIKLAFWVRQNLRTFMIPIYSNTVLYDLHNLTGKILIDHQTNVKNRQNLHLSKYCTIRIAI